jgi:ABC-type transport system involved in cytochrome bd biosynthesis fused ATPase/permease subunit
LLFTEIYLDKYFADPNKLLTELNEFVELFNDPLQNDIPNQFDFVAQKFTLAELSKIAIWSATGSGKTLLLHVNIKQYLYYAKKYNMTLASQNAEN